ncbi:hypothetical protein BMS3Bbin04_01690 [bacterium BMS3Bbin04]|nr:hypothetical protein BMS3Bbin04_01690 [bacterium BMS3Bbin04]
MLECFAGVESNSHGWFAIYQDTDVVVAAQADVTFDIYCHRWNLFQRVRHIPASIGDTLANPVYFSIWSKCEFRTSGSDLDVFQFKGYRVQCQYAQQSAWIIGVDLNVLDQYLFIAKCSDQQVVSTFLDWG